jgi:hypothetical protein
MKTESLDLTVAEHELVVSGVRFTRTGLRFDGKPTEATVSTVSTVLHTVRDVLDWCEADYLPQMVQLHLGRSARKRKPDANLEQMEIRIVSEYAELNGRDAAALHERDKVGRFFPIALRHDDLSFAHHAEAWRCCDGDLAQASAWLDVASSDKLKIGPFRALIRRQARADQFGQAGAHISVLDPLEDERTDMDLAAARMRAAASRYGSEQAQRELRSIANVVALVDELRTKANAMQSRG